MLVVPQGQDAPTKNTTGDINVCPSSTELLRGDTEGGQLQTLRQGVKRTALGWDI